MSTITERKKDRKVIAFKFVACIGRDTEGKRICKGTTWKPPEGLTYAKARKLAEAEAYRWEQELRCGEGSAFQQGLFSLPHSAPSEAVQTVEEVPEENVSHVLQGIRENSVIEIVQVGTGTQMTPAEVYAANVNSTVGITTSVTTWTPWKRSPGMRE